MNKPLISSLLTLSMLAAGTATYATGVRLAFIDPLATARGNAFTATADTPAAVFYNAAGLTQIENSALQASAYAVSLEYEYDGLAGSAESDDSIQPIPNFFAAHNFEDSPIAIGFGAYAPFGLNVDWGTGNPIALAAESAELTYIKYHLVLAWEISETLSVGFGASFDDAEIELETAGPLGDLKGDDDTIGYSLSVLWRPSEEHAFGLNYQAATSMDFEGSHNNFFSPIVGPGGGVFSGPAVASIDFPESIVFGYSWRPNEKWNIEFDLDWTNWDRVDNLTIKDIAGTSQIPLNWESSFIWELGATHYLENGWHLSAGYTFAENSIPDAEFLPLVPDADRHFINLGVGRAYEQLAWQLTYQYVISEERNVTGSSAGVLSDGEYDLASQALAFSLSYAF